MAKILVIEDSSAITKIIQAMLIRDGHTTLSTGDGPTGITMARAESPDLMILDLDLGTLSIPGEQVAQYMQQDPVLKSIPIIVVTANEDRDMETMLLKLGSVRFYLHKPINQGELRSRIREVLPDEDDPIIS
jgi:twitching motility two-component system response regulator PilH